MVLPSNAVPAGDSWIARELRSLREALREGLASVATSFRSTVENLAAAQGVLVDQVAFLAGQTQFAITNATLYNLNITSPRSDYTPAFDADRLASMTITTSSTGKLLVDAECQWSVFPAANRAIAISWTLYVEFLLGGTQVVGPSTGAPQTSIVRSIPAAASFANSTADAMSVRDVVTLNPNTTYTARCRVLVESLATGNDLDISPVSLAITKLGM